MEDYIENYATYEPIITDAEVSAVATQFYEAHQHEISCTPQEILDRIQIEPLIVFDICRMKREADLPNFFMLTESLRYALPFRKLHVAELNIDEMQEVLNEQQLIIPEALQQKGLEELIKTFFMQNLYYGLHMQYVPNLSGSHVSDSAAYMEEKFSMALLATKRFMLSQGRPFITDMCTSSRLSELEFSSCDLNDEATVNSN
jgi:hypothetical protein